MVVYNVSNIFHTLISRLRLSPKRAYNTKHYKNIALKQEPTFNPFRINQFLAELFQAVSLAHRMSNINVYDQKQCSGSHSLAPGRPGP